MSEKSEDCLSCRLITGFAAIGIGAYILHQAKHRKKLEQTTMKLISAGAVTIGVARLMNLEIIKSKSGGKT